jgi:hypothetical protein
MKPDQPNSARIRQLIIHTIKSNEYVLKIQIEVILVIRFINYHFSMYISILCAGMNVAWTFVVKWLWSYLPFPNTFQF